MSVTLSGGRRASVTGNLERVAGVRLNGGVRGGLLAARGFVRNTYMVTCGGHPRTSVGLDARLTDADGRAGRAR